VVHRFCVLIVLLLFHCSAYAEDTTSVVHFFPSKKIFPLFTADGLAHQLSLSRVTENHDWIGAIGGSVPAVQFNLADATLQASIAVTVFNRLVKTPGHLEVYTVDYKVDLPFDVRFERLAVRVGLGHLSCHFADDALELYGKRSIQHVNDYVTLAGAYDIPLIGGYVYAGTNYSYGTQPIQHRPWLLQAGAHFGNIAVHELVTLYGAVDVKVKQEVGWGSTRSVQLGARLFPNEPRGVRFAYTLRTGFEDRGQFYLNTTTLNLLSVLIDF
jgi:hypothetical protein